MAELMDIDVDVDLEQRGTKRKADEALAGVTAPRRIRVRHCQTSHLSLMHVS